MHVRCCKATSLPGKEQIDKSMLVMVAGKALLKCLNVPSVQIFIFRQHATGLGTEKTRHEHDLELAKQTGSVTQHAPAYTAT